MSFLWCHHGSKKRMVFTCVIILGLVVPLGLGELLPASRIYVQHASAETAPDLNLIEEAWKIIQRDYVDRPAVDPRALTYGAISGMVDTLGDSSHSAFLSPTMAKLQKNATQGGFEGIGAQVQIKSGNLVVVAPIDGSPAQRAGLLPGDIILKVDGQEITGLPLTKTGETLLGAKGTSVTLTILSPSSRSARDITLVRASIVVHDVAWLALPGTDVALVRIVMFSEGVTRELKKALELIKAQGFRGVILDLRNNPGGLLGEAVGVASQFLKTGNVLLEKNAKGKISPVPVQPGGVLSDLPLVVIINNGSASGAEIVAGALHDVGRAKLVGETTFGTGAVLNPFSLSDGSVLLLAVQEWLTPNGHTIWRKGIDPDVIVSLPQGAFPLLPSTISALTSQELKKSDDRQLLRALDMFERRVGKDR